MGSGLSTAEQPSVKFRITNGVHCGEVGLASGPPRLALSTVSGLQTVTRYVLLKRVHSLGLSGRYTVFLPDFYTFLTGGKWKATFGLISVEFAHLS